MGSLIFSRRKSRDRRSSLYERANAREKGKEKGLQEKIERDRDWSNRWKGGAKSCARQGQGNRDDLHISRKE